MSSKLKSLVVAPRWNKTPQMGCCGIGTVSRLNATFVIKSEQTQALDEYDRDFNKVPHTALIGGSLPARARHFPNTQHGWPLKRILKNIQRRANSTGWRGAATTVEMAYYAVLDDMYHGRYAIYFMSDNMSGDGDIHLGPFNTRNFVVWLTTTKNFGASHTTGPITSLRTGHYIQGWMFVPNWDIIAPALKKARADLFTYIKELNAYGNIKEKGQQARYDTARESAQLTEDLLAEWR